jgi:hypothetical protein
VAQPVWNVRASSARMASAVTRSIS